MRNQISTICDLRQQKKMNGNLNYHCGSIYTLIEMVKKNKGITLLPELALTDNDQINNKNIFKIIEPVPSRKVGIVTHKHFVKRKILKDIIQMISDIAANAFPKKRSKLKTIHPF